MAFSGMLLVSTDSLITRAVDADGWSVVFWLGLLTMPTMAVYLVIQEGRDLDIDALARQTGVVPLLGSGVLQAASTLLFILAVKQTSIANVVVIVAAAPVLAALCATIFLGERSSPKLWAAIFVSLVGIVVVVSGSFGGGGLLGDLLAVGAILGFALNLTVWRRYPDMSRTLAVGIAGFVMVIVAIAPAQVSGYGARTYLLLVLLGAVAGPLARVMLASSTRYLPVATVSLFTPVETVAASVWAWLAFDERPIATTWIGGAIVLAAVLYGTVFANDANADVVGAAAAEGAAAGAVEEGS